MAGLDRQDRGPELDPPGRPPHERDRGQRVEVPGDLGHPDRAEASLLGRFGVGDELRHLVAMPSSLWADHQADAHSKVSFILTSRSRSRIPAPAAGAGTSILILREYKFHGESR